MADAPAQHPAAPPATVADVMQPPVTAVEQNDHAAAAAYLMKRAGATALIVTKMQTGQPTGIITEADISRAVADGKNPNDVRIYELMTTNPDLSSGLMAGAEGRLAGFATTILGSGYDGGPAGGPGGRGFPQARGGPSWVAGMVHAGQGACGSASMRCHAAVMAAAQGQVAWIFRRRRRPPRTSRAAACSTR